MFTFKVTPDGGEPYQVVAGSRDLRMWEKAGPNRSIGKLLADMRMSALYEVAHIAARRQQLFTGTLDDFGNTCELTLPQEYDTEYDDGEGPSDPTQPVP